MMQGQKNIKLIHNMFGL